MASAVRQASKEKSLISSTAGLAPAYLQANLIVLPAQHAADFRRLCQRNPVPCPLIAESIAPGIHDKLRSYLPNVLDHQLIADVDVRHDLPRYFVYQEGVFQRECLDIQQYWSEDSVAFLIGCSYSFEAALAEAGLPAAHVATNTIVPMYRTTLPLCPSGIFDRSTYVVSMRPYLRSDLEKVRSITRLFSATHGEPIAWGLEGAEKLGIKDLRTPDWGDKPSVELADIDYIPVFWGCGVTTQEAVMRACLPQLVMSHAPGHMLLLDVKDDHVFNLSGTES
ncbi:DUF1445-domain-containing protein [Myriangium duriaei CBS 260.36]|uniref:DUF1445-domain-containing protein n=1 Tax=Myriangium duriaei CBS 260.36 TaxID=1168546 RepID=A0A9P4MBI9_9PEZI|nr:DUF1445-domain-containing protein [Myriangium duriaei CBS 260.36]